MDFKKLILVFIGLVIVGGLAFLIWAGDLGDFQAPSARDYAPNFWFDSEEKYYPASPLSFYYDENLNEISGLSAKSKYDSLSLDEKLNNFTIFYKISSEDGQWIYEYWPFYVFNIYRVNEHYGDWEPVYVFVDKSTRKINKIVTSAHIGSTIGNYLFILPFSNNETGYPGSNHVRILVERGAHANWPDGDQDGLVNKIGDVTNWYNAYKISGWSLEDKLHGAKIAFDNPNYKLEKLADLEEKLKGKESFTESPTLGSLPVDTDNGTIYLLPGLGGAPADLAYVQSVDDPARAQPITTESIIAGITGFGQMVWGKVQDAGQLVLNTATSIFTQAKNTVGSILGQVKDSFSQLLAQVGAVFKGSEPEGEYIPLPVEEDKEDILVTDEEEDNRGLKSATPDDDRGLKSATPDDNRSLKAATPDEGSATSDGDNRDLKVATPAEKEEIEEEKEEDKRVSGRVIINEIAWMGTVASYNDEWIELRNLELYSINLSGWTLKAEDGSPEIELSGTVQSQGYYLLERTDNNTISDVSADQIYTGALSNDGENLILENYSGSIIDRVDCSEGWFAGENETKKTMERGDPTKVGLKIGGWQTNDGMTINGQDAEGNAILGTPRARNSTGQAEEEVEEENGQQEQDEELEEEKDERELKFATPEGEEAKIVINEIMYDLDGSDSGREWVEIYNFGENSVDLSGWRFYENGINHKLTLYQGDATISQGGYALIINEPNKFLADNPNYSGTLLDSSFSLENGGELIAVRDSSLNDIDKVTYSSDWGAKGDGNSLQRKTSDYRGLKSATPESNWQAGIPTPGALNLTKGAFSSGGGSSAYSLPPEESSEDSSEGEDSSDLSEQEELKVIITEVQIEGEKASYDFIELYNPSDKQADISGCQLKKRNKNGTESSIKVFPQGSSILSKGYFLWASSKDGYNQIIEADVSSTSYLTQDNSIALFGKNSNIIDAVAWGTGHSNPFKEGEVFDINPETRDIIAEYLSEIGGFIGTRIPFPSSIYYQSLGRKIAEPNDYQDTNNNSQDFEIQNPTPRAKNETFEEPDLNDILEGIDVIPPEISNIQISDITESSALITWKTDEESTSSLEYGLSQDYGETKNSTDYVFSHSITLANLDPGINYHYRVGSTDEDGNLKWSQDNTFTTLKEENPGENTPPIASFTYSPQNPFVGEPITFDASSSTSTTPIINFEWDFGDSYSTSTTGWIITYSYATSTDYIVYIVGLTVTDEDGATDTATSTISVGEAEEEEKEKEKEKESFEFGAVVINEIAWMGTEASSADEWIEFYNSTSSPVDIKNWSIRGADTGECLNFDDADGYTNTIIPTHGYLLYANHKDDIKDSDEANIVDIWDATIGMNNSSPGQLILYDALDCGGNVIDIANQTTGDWFAGENESEESRKTMERNDSLVSGSDQENWHTIADLSPLLHYDADGNPILGTPKAQNSVEEEEDTTPPAPSPTIIPDWWTATTTVTWTSEGSPYILESSSNQYPTVEEGATLIIEPGVVIKGANKYYPSLVVKGILEAEGTADNSIIFTANTENPEPGDWKGIVFDGSFGSILKNVVFEYGGFESDYYLDGEFINSSQEMIRAKSSSLTISNNSNFRNSAGGIIYAADSVLNIEDSTFNLSEGGVYAQGDVTAITIANSEFSVLTFYGIKAENGAFLTVENSNFREIGLDSNNEKYPIEITSAYPALSGNSAENCGVNGVYFNSSSVFGQDFTLKSDLPYVFQSNLGEQVTVAEGVTLTLEPGVVIKAALSGGGIPQQYDTLLVKGTLIAEGGEDDFTKIVFTSFKDDEYGGDTNNDGIAGVDDGADAPAPGDWKRIVFAPESADSVLRNALFRYGGPEDEIITIEGEEASEEEEILDQETINGLAWQAPMFMEGRIFGQTFTVGQQVDNIKIFRASLRKAYPSTSGMIYLDIYETEEGFPTGESLGYTSFDGTEAIGIGWTWVDFVLPEEISLNSGTRYVAVMGTENGEFPIGRYKWQYVDRTLEDYLGGTAVKLFGREEKLEKDFMFQTWYLPPADTESSKVDMINVEKEYCQ